jgi:TRAP-type C4-dicarboxylate transport system permease small subunit
VAMIYLAISFAASQDAHIRIELQFQYMPKLLSFTLLTTADLAWLFYNAVIIKVGIDVVVSLFKFPYISPVLRISMAYLYIIIPFGFLIMSFRIIQNMILRMLRLTQLTEL